MTEAQRPAQNETALVKRIRKALLARYPQAFVVKTHGSPMQAAGLPDLLVVVPPAGVLVALEVKHRKPGESEARARGRVTPLQEVRLDELSRAGAVVGVVLDEEEALATTALAARAASR